MYNKGNSYVHAPLMQCKSLTIPLARLLGGVISLTTAKLRLTFPLLMPPMMRAITNTVKLCENAHTAYDSAIPI